MPATLESPKTYADPTTQPLPQRPTSEARVSAVVQAAYILEARSR
jgi:hypothetical protein